MNDYSELRKLADDVNQNFPNKEELWNMVCTPTIVLDLIADHDKLVSKLCVCRECGGRGEIHTGDWSDEGYFQPPEPVMAKCGECDGDGVIGNASDLTSLLAENAKLKAECEGLRKDAELHAQIQRAAGELPAGWEIRVCVEHEAGYVELWDQDGCEVDFPNSCETLALTVSDAIDHATGKEASNG